MEKMVTELFCASIHTLKQALAKKNQLKCIDNTIVTYKIIKRSKNLNSLTCREF